jgi:NAD(P)-dependent dehydrogenase (short-subunit alcohol dehydrogenase family)
VRTDVADPDQCQSMVDAALSEFGRVDVLVNNAGIGTAFPANERYCATTDLPIITYYVRIIGPFSSDESRIKAERPAQVLMVRYAAKLIDNQEYSTDFRLSALDALNLVAERLRGDDETEEGNIGLSRGIENHAA